MAPLPERAAAGALLLALAGCAEPAASPAGAPLADARVAALASGGDRSYATFSHACAVVDSALQCWGAGDRGQLGAGILAPRRPLPVRVPELERVTSIAAGGAHTCAVAAGVLHCWGSNERRQLARQKPFVVLSPRVVSGLPSPVIRVAAGRVHSCAVAGGALWCWGGSEAGELGSTPDGTCASAYGPASCRATPRRVEGLAGEPSAVALGDAHSCALTSDTLMCWGANDRGQLGDATTRSRSRPAPVSGLPAPVTAIAAGAAHTCAVAGGRVYCWGANEAGQLGDGSRADRATPVRVRGLPDAALAVAAGRRHACALARGGVHCWGDNGEQQLGTADPRGRGPVRVRGLGDRATGVAAGADQSCAALEDARVACWGANDFGQLGRGRTGPGRGPAQVGPWDSGAIRDADRDGRIVVACLGDSNTERSERRPVSWCDELGELLADPAWTTVNRGLGGATATEATLRPAREQLEYALANDAPDVVIAAFGTNDLIQRVELEEILLAYHRLRRRAAGAGAAFFVALTAPAMPDSHALNGKVEALNEALRRTFPAERVIDFWSGFAAGDFSDSIHLGASGQARRAGAALEALRAAGAPGEEP